MVSLPLQLPSLWQKFNKLNGVNIEAKIFSGFDKSAGPHLNKKQFNRLNHFDT